MAKEMDDSQAFLFYADKFYSGTADMLPETVGIYIRLLAKLWNMPEGLPNDLKKLARISLVSERKFNQCWHTDMLSEKFFENSNGALQNERLEIVREKRLRKSITARESADKRWNKTDANAMRTHSERNANGMHISKEKISKENKESNKEKVAAFTKPTWNEVGNFIFKHLLEKDINPDKLKVQAEANSFVDYYESKGWLVGKSPMRNWQAAARRWVIDKDVKAEVVQQRKFLGED
jgi:uncharacterized protein YdaU (DUF1376 family)